MQKSFIVKANGIRKAHHIKKFEDRYYLALAYVGLLEMEKTREGHGSGTGYNDTRLEYSADTSVDTLIGNIAVRAYMEIEKKDMTGYYGDMLYRDAKWDVPKEERNGMEWENMSLWADNMAGMSEVTAEGRLAYYILKHDGETEKLADVGTGKCYSAEDCLDRMTQLSEEVWGNVQIRLNDVKQMNQEYEDSKVALPDTISIPTPTQSMELSFKESSYGEDEFSWSGRYDADLGDGITMSAKVRIRAEQTDTKGRHTDERWADFDRYASVDYYSVKVTGTIYDNNTQTEWSIQQSETPDQWERVFDGQGAVSLDGAIAIASQNIAEVYQEAQDYLQSERNYSEVRNGRGNRRTTVNDNEWNYNFGDTFEDIKYYERMGENKDLNAEDPYGLLGTFGYDLVGDSKKILDYDVENDGSYHFKQNSWYKRDEKYYTSDFARVDLVTQDAVENIANLHGMHLVSYNNPYDFVLAKGKKKAQSFNDMLKQQRAKNRKS